LPEVLKTGYGFIPKKYRTERTEQTEKIFSLIKFPVNPFYPVRKFPEKHPGFKYFMKACIGKSGCITAKQCTRLFIQ
jgi:hypothetical protein